MLTCQKEKKIFLYLNEFDIYKKNRIQYQKFNRLFLKHPVYICINTYTY